MIPTLLAFSWSWWGGWWWWWFDIGCYLAPENYSTIDRSVAAISQWDHGSALLVSRYFNADLTKQEVLPCDEEIVAAILVKGLEYMSDHLLLCRRP